MTIKFSGSDRLVFLPGNAQAIGSRSEQEDSFGFSDPQDGAFAEHGGLLAVLADGMGGMEHGGEASRIAVRVFLERYNEKRPDETVAQALSGAIEAADRAVFDFAAGLGLEREVGSTLVAAVFLGDCAQWISAGDSALYLSHSSELIMLTRPHNLAARLEALVAKGQLSAEAVRQNPDRDALTSYIGAGGIPEIDASDAPVSLAEGDCALLCSDGLYRALDAGEIGAVLDGAQTGQQACDHLIESALGKNLRNQDNVTALCVKVERANLANSQTRLVR